MSLNVAKGLCLFEILISLVLITMMLISFDVVQIHTLRSMQELHYLNIAHNQMDNLIEFNRAESEASKKIQYQEEWNLQNHQLLPNGVGQDCVKEKIITISWGLVKCDCSLNQKKTKQCLKVEYMA